jgi:sulfide:quinone oxidoreductase
VAASVVIAGTGLAGVEALLGLRELAGDLVDVVLVGPAGELLHQPLGDAPWTMGGVHRHPVDAVADRLGARCIQDAVVAVDPDARCVRLREGGDLGYDALLVAVGARHVMSLDHAIEFGSPLDVHAVEELLDLVRRGAVETIAVTVPAGAAWSLPAYEVALRAAAVGARATVLTPEAQPAEVFGAEASAAVADALERAGVEVVRGTVEDTEPDAVCLDGGRRIPADAVVALPWVEGYGMAGLPRDEGGFLPTGPTSEVQGVDAVWAAGDATAFPIRQGGIACQQAATAACAIAAAAGAGVTPEPLRPVLRGALPTGEGALWLEHDLSTGASRASADPLWDPPHRVAGVRLPGLLEALDAGAR